MASPSRRDRCWSADSRRTAPATAVGGGRPLSRELLVGGAVGSLEGRRRKARKPLVRRPLRAAEQGHQVFHVEHLEEGQVA